MIRSGTTLIFLLLVQIATCQSLTSSRKVIDNMLASIDKIETLRFKLKKAERVNGEMRVGEQEVKFNRNPFKVYTNVLWPNKGVEILFLVGQNNNEAYINPNAFPYINVNLDPFGSTMRKNNHHTVYEVGFDYIKGIVSHIEAKCTGNFEKIFIYDGEVKFNNRDCHKIVIDYLPYKYITYTVKPGETLTNIAYKNFLSDYMILQLNKATVTDYHDVKVGQQIIIPNAYAKKTILYIDKEKNLPVMQMMYDEKGLYEQYEFSNVQVNPVIKDEEFTRGYKDYNF